MATGHGSSHNHFLVNVHTIPPKYRWVFQNGYLRESEIKQLQTDDTGLFSITPAKDANRMSALCANLPGIQDLGRKPVITDGCACVGGNVLSFALSGLFAEVNAVELDAARARMLEHNVAVIRDRVQIPVNILTGSYTDLMQTLRQDIVFLDPPWGGPGYKTQKSVNLFLGDSHLADVIHNVFSNTETIYVVWKAPTNFDEVEMSTRTKELGFDIMVLERFAKYILYYSQKERVEKHYDK